MPTDTPAPDHPPGRPPTPGPAAGPSSPGGPSGPGAPGLVVAVAATSGGAGASVLAAALAVRARLAGRSVCLVDLDPWGGGLDVVVGVEQEPGVRWPDLAGLRGAADGAALLAALPGADLRGAALPVLAHDPRTPGPPEDVVGEVVDALAGVVELVVLDRPCRLQRPRGVVDTRVDQELLVVRPGVGGVAALTAHRTQRPVGPAAQVVLRGVDDRARDELVVLLAEHLGLRVAAVLPDDRALARDLLHGVPPGCGRGPLAMAADTLLLRLLPAAADLGWAS